MSVAAIADLHPIFQPIAKRILADTAELIYPSSLRAGSTFRTLAEQAELKRRGATALLLSFHNFGLAFDAVIFTPTGAYITDGHDWRYRIFGITAERHGCVWGGRFSTTRPDSGHVQLAGDMGVSQFATWSKEHKVAF